MDFVLKINDVEERVWPLNFSLTFDIRKSLGPKNGNIFVFVAFTCVQCPIPSSIYYGN